MFGAFLIKRFLFPRELFDDDVMPPSQNLEDFNKIPTHFTCTYSISNPYKIRHLTHVTQVGEHILAYELETKRVKKFLIKGIKVIH